MTRTEVTREDERTVDVITNAPVPPDGGWGWVVVVASFFVSVIIDGICFTVGIFYDHFLDEYGESKSTTAWVGSVLNGTYLFFGVLVSALANRFGCRRVTLIGSIVASASFFVSSFSPNIGTLILFYGFTGGFGFGLMYLPSLVMVGYYFEKKRAFATGIAVCGSGIGAFVLAPICEYLIEKYSWHRALWILSGIVANGAVMGALFRPLDPVVTIVESAVGEEIGNVAEYQSGNSTGNTQVNAHGVVITSIENQELLDTTRNVRTNTSKDENSQDSQNTDSHRRRPMSLSIDTTSRDCNVDYSELGKYGQHHTVKVSDLDRSHSSKKIGANELLNLAKSQDSGFTHIKKHSKHEQSTHGFLDVSRPLYRKDIFYSGSVIHLPEYASTNNMTEYLQSVTKIPAENETRISRCLRCFRCPKLSRDVLGNMLDLSLFKQATFVIYAISCSFIMAGFFIPFTYIPVLAKRKGIDATKAAFLVSVLGITNTVGRIITGFFCDKKWVDALVVNNVTLILAGVVTLAVPFYDNYGALAAYCTLYGLLISPFVSLRTVIAVELLGLDKLTNTFGFITMFQGCASFVGVPLAGALVDYSKTFDSSFYFSGAVLCLSGVMCLPLRRLSRWEKRRNKDLRGISLELQPVLSRK